MQICLGKYRIINVVLFIDSLIILLNVANSYSIIPYLLFSQYYRAINTGIITIINVVYIILRFRSKISISSKDYLFFLFVLINLTNLLFGTITKTYGIGMLPFIFSNTSFYIILYNLYKKYTNKFSFNESIWLIIRGYIWLCIASIISSILLFLLISLFDFYPLINNIGDSMDLFKGNLERNPSISYYYPYGISIIEKTKLIRIPFFQKYGVIDGLFHEPHTLTFVVIPSIFLFFDKLSSRFLKILIITAYILVMLISASTTNILAVLLCLAVFIFIKYRKRMVNFLIILGIIFVIFLMLDKSLFSFIVDKVYSRSADYSLATIKYAFSPKTFIGTSFYNLDYWDNQNTNLNIGYINFFLNLGFLSIFIHKIIKLNFAMNFNIRLTGLFLLYFFLHSMKITMFAYSLSYLILAIFLLNVYSDRLVHLHSTSKIDIHS